MKKKECLVCLAYHFPAGNAHQNSKLLVVLSSFSGLLMNMQRFNEICIVAKLNSTNQGQH